MNVQEILAEFTDEQQQKIQQAMFANYLEQSQAEKAQKVEQFRRLNKFVQKKQILFAGSSLMEQFPINEMMQGLDIPLAIYNRGVGGFTTAEMQAVMGPCVYDVDPAYIFINIGTNDLNEKACTPEVLKERYRVILDGIKENCPDANLFLLAYYPVNEIVGQKMPWMAQVLKERNNAKIQAANCAVQELAAEYDARYLDLNAGITDADGNQKAEYTKEGMHFYADGYKQVLDALLPVLRECR